MSLFYTAGLGVGDLNEIHIKTPKINFGVFHVLTPLPKWGHLEKVEKVDTKNVLIR